MGHFDAPSEREKKRLRPTVRMGGSVTRNGVNVDKQIERQTAAKHKALQKKKDNRVHVMNRVNEIRKANGWEPINHATQSYLHKKTFGKD